jgi:arsenical pump membrane protein
MTARSGAGEPPGSPAAPSPGPLRGQAASPPVRRGEGILRLALLGAGAAAAIAAAAAAPDRAAAAASQAWPAFVLVAGLLVIGELAARDGLFAAAGAAAARLPGEGFALFGALSLLVAVVTAVLNLDTSVVFLTPVLLHAARRRGLDEAPFLYCAVFMSNAASLLLPGSNLTNLIVLAREHVEGTVFADRMAPAWAAAILVTAVVLALVFRRELRLVGEPAAESVPLRIGPGVIGAAAAAVVVLLLRDPALPVFGLAVALALVARESPQRLAEAASPTLLLGVLGLAVGLGALTRGIEPIADLTEGIGRWATAGVAAGTAIAINNLPAAVVLSAHTPAHPRALLLGLDLGPNLAVTGSLSAVLWLRVARSAGGRPSARRYSLLGLAVVPASLAAALGALSLSLPTGF